MANIAMLAHRSAETDTEEAEIGQDPDDALPRQVLSCEEDADS